MNDSKPMLEDIEKYTDKHGAQKTGRLLSVLGKDKQFTAAWESPVGKDIMGKLLSMSDDGLTMMINEDYGNLSEERVKAEYRVCMTLLKYFQDRINKYGKNLKELKGGK